MEKKGQERVEVLGATIQNTEMGFRLSRRVSVLGRLGWCAVPGEITA
ncbi:MAG: hypothetical protein ACLTFZ_01445 [Lachnospiraceae bacterium]